MKRHFVVFLSPGTFVAESTTKEIESWNPELAKEMASEIQERHGATPYGFYFITRERRDDELDSKVVAKSGKFFLGGTVYTLEDIKAKNDPNDHILIINMECSGYSRVVINTNSWKWTQPLGDNDVVLQWP